MRETALRYAVPSSDIRSDNLAHTTR